MKTEKKYRNDRVLFKARFTVLRINCAPSWFYLQDWIITLTAVATVYTGKNIRSAVENRKQDRRYNIT